MNLRNKVLLPVFFFIIILLIFGLSILQYLGEQEAILEQSKERIDDIQRFSRELLTIEHETTVSLLSFRFDQHQKHLDVVFANTVEVAHLLDRFKKLIDTEEGDRLLKKYVESRKGIRETRESLIDAIRSENLEEINNNFRKWDLQQKTVEAHLSDVTAYIIRSLDRDIGAIEALGDRLLKAITALVIFSFISFIFLLAYYRRNLLEPIKSLHTATKSLEKEHYETSVTIKTGDELEWLGNAFNKTIESLGRVREREQEIDRAKTEFLSITSHELRSPMTPMRAQLQMILGGYFGKTTKEQKEALDIVLRNTCRLDSIIEDFLEVSRIEAARLHFNFTKTNLEPYIQRLVKEMNGFLPGKKIKISVKMSSLPKFEADPDRVMQVLRNLITNAKKFSPKNSTVFLHVKNQKDWLFFSVEDSGVGIKKKHLLRIFEPFFQEESAKSRKLGGTGLGLAICRGIVESQGGKLTVESVEGKGTTFHFTIPKKPVKKIKPIKLLFSNH